ncbi:MAG: tRNA (cytidine(34)-2'-O)-methyltransferase [Dehalococcoidia bacterium]
MPFNVALIAPEMPQNTGNIIRLCANTGSRLHLVEPLGFSLDEKQLRRASLDYRDLTDVVVHETFDSFMTSIDPTRAFATTTGGTTTYDQVEYQDGDTVIFGSESQGLPNKIIAEFHPDNRISIPMMPANRSLNLSNAVATVVYEMWRQQSFAGSETPTADSSKYFS